MEEDGGEGLCEGPPDVLPGPGSPMWGGMAGMAASKPRPGERWRSGILWESSPLDLPGAPATLD